MGYVSAEENSAFLFLLFGQGKKVAHAVFLACVVMQEKVRHGVVGTLHLGGTDKCPFGKYDRGSGVVALGIDTHQGQCIAIDDVAVHVTGV